MSFYEDSSIIITPNAYKAGTLYAVAPTSGLADMDFTRATAATRVDENGLVADVLSGVPRIDYTGGGCPHILAEPQRTNLITYSEAFDNAYWTKNNSSVVIGQSSPSGDTSAFKLVESVGVAAHFIQMGTISYTPTNDYTLSVFAKSTERYMQLLFDNSPFPDGTFANFDLITGVVGTSNGCTSTITIMDDGWYKCTITATSDATTTATGGYFMLQDNSSAVFSDTYTGDGVSGVYIWGASLELGSYATSYIPTAGATVTRNQDVFTKDGISSLINSEEGVLFAEIAALSNDGTSRDISVSDGSSSNYARISLSNAVGKIEYNVVVGGSTKASGVSAITQTNFNKIAVKWKVNDFALWVNGSEVLTDLSGTSFTASTLTTLNFDRGSGTNYFYGKVKQLQVYPTALSDSELTILTTP